MTLHIGIVGCSAEGAALCYKTICIEGAALLGPHAHPEVSMHTPSLAEYTRCLDAGDLAGVGALMLGSAHKLAAAGADFLICPDNLKGEEGCDAVVLGCTEIPLIMSDANSPLPTLDSTRLLARAALRRATQP